MNSGTATAVKSVLLDASFQLSENPEHNLLVGGVDEFTDLSLKIQNRFGIFRNKSNSSLDLFKPSSKGTLPGEGAFYLALSGKRTKKSLASIDTVETFFKPTKEELLDGIDQFMEFHDLKKGGIDLVLAGKSGDNTADLLTNAILTEAVGSSPVGVFKHLCGEYSTSSAFAVWLGVRIIQSQNVPSVILDKSFKGSVKNILIYNPYFENYHSLILLKSC